MSPIYPYLNKYKARKTGGKASALEESVHGILKILVAAGEISDLRSQPNIFLTRAKIRMIPDFSAIDVKTRETVYFEAKGFETERWFVCKKLWKVYGPGKLCVYRGSWKRPFLAEEIIPTG